jgi:hypothetical protein
VVRASGCTPQACLDDANGIGGSWRSENDVEAEAEVRRPHQQISVRRDQLLKRASSVSGDAETSATTAASVNME